MLESLLDLPLVPYVAVDLTETVKLFLEYLHRPLGTRILSKEIPAHIVVDADDVEPQIAEVLHRLGSD